MLLNTDYISPAELTGFVRADLEQFHLNENNAFFAQWLPNDTIDDIRYAFSEGGELESNVASYRAYDAESPIGARPGRTRVEGEIPPISEKIRLGEYDILRRRRDPEEAIRNVILRDARRQARGIARRVELARAEALLTGKVTLVENGLALELDFGRDGDLTATPGTAWSTTASSDPVSDLLAWQLLLRQRGSEPAVILAAPEVITLATRSKKIIDAVVGAAAQQTQVTVDQLNAHLQAHGLPPMEPYTANVGGIRPLGNNKLLMLPAPVGAANTADATVGTTLWGTPAEALEEAYELDVDNGEGPGVVSGVYKVPQPVALWTNTSAIVVPLLAAPNSVLAATVQAAA